MRFLLDTSVISDFVRGHWAVRERLLRTSPSELAVSALTLMEVEYGLARDPSRARRIRPIADELLARIAPIPCGTEEARATGRLRAELARQGTPIGPFDSLIAGTALVHRLVLVTSNTGEFRRVPRLAVEDWHDSQVHDREGE